MQQAASHGTIRCARLSGSHHRGPVILVNQATPRIHELYQRLGYDLRFLDAPRRISCDGDRTPAREILATRHL
jgi:DNA adenine methylase